MVFPSFVLLVVRPFVFVDLLVSWPFGLLAFGLSVFRSLVLSPFGLLVFGLGSFVFVGLSAFDILVFWSFGLMAFGLWSLVFGLYVGLCGYGLYL